MRNVSLSMANISIISLELCVTGDFVWSVSYILTIRVHDNFICVNGSTADEDVRLRFIFHTTSFLAHNSTTINLCNSFTEKMLNQEWRLNTCKSIDLMNWNLSNRPIAIEAEMAWQKQTGSKLLERIILKIFKRKNAFDFDNARYQIEMCSKIYCGSH